MNDLLDTLKTKMLVNHAKNVGKSQNTMKPFFLIFPLINNVVLVCPPPVLVIIDYISNFQDFLSFLQFINTPLKGFLK